MLVTYNFFVQINDDENKILNIDVFGLLIYKKKKKKEMALYTPHAEVQQDV